MADIMIMCHPPLHEKWASYKRNESNKPVDLFWPTTEDRQKFKELAQIMIDSTVMKVQTQLMQTRETNCPSSPTGSDTTRHSDSGMYV